MCGAGFSVPGLGGSLSQVSGLAGASDGDSLLAAVQVEARYLLPAAAAAVNEITMISLIIKELLGRAYLGCSTCHMSR